jgi:hypothetical protein
MKQSDLRMSIQVWDVDLEPQGRNVLWHISACTVFDRSSQHVQRLIDPIDLRGVHTHVKVKMKDDNHIPCGNIYTSLTSVVCIRVNDLKPALHMAAAILPVYEHIFELAYVLPKLDLVAIPDFAAGM